MDKGRHAGEVFGLSPQDLVRVLGGHTSNFLNDLVQGKHNYTPMPPVSRSSHFNPLDTKWNYRNMHDTIMRERINNANEILGTPMQVGVFSD